MSKSVKSKKQVSSVSEPQNLSSTIDKRDHQTLTRSGSNYEEALNTALNVLNPIEHFDGGPDADEIVNKANELELQFYN